MSDSTYYAPRIGYKGRFVKTSPHTCKCGEWAHTSYTKDGIVTRSCLECLQNPPASAKNAGIANLLRECGLL